MTKQKPKSEIKKNHARREKRGFFKSLILWFFLLGLFFVVCGAGAGLFIYYSISKDLPKITSLSDYHPTIITTPYKNISDAFITKGTRLSSTGSFDYDADGLLDFYTYYDQDLVADFLANADNYPGGVLDAVDDLYGGAGHSFYDDVGENMAEELEYYDDHDFEGQGPPEIAQAMGKKAQGDHELAAMPFHVAVKKVLETGVKQEQAGVEQLRHRIADGEDHTHAVLDERYLMGGHYETLPLQ